MSDLGSRLKAFLIPFYPSWEAEIGKNPHFDRDVAAEILSPVLGSVCCWWGLFFEERSCLPSPKKLKGEDILVKKKKVKEKTPKDSALLHGMESLQVMGGQGRTVGTAGLQNPGLQNSDLCSCLGR